MNRTKLILKTAKAMVAILFFWSAVSTAYAKDKECWAEFFQGSQYAGKQFRLEGPVQLENLSNVDGENWESRIESLKVGSKARVTVFENANFKLTLKEMEKYPDLLRSLGLTEKDAMEDKELIFIANSRIHDLSDFNFRNKIRSLKIDCEH
jgi:Beta/Gamma crystallin